MHFQPCGAALAVPCQGAVATNNAASAAKTVKRVRIGASPVNCRAGALARTVRQHAAVFVLDCKRSLSWQF